MLIILNQLFYTHFIFPISNTMEKIGKFEFSEEIFPKGVFPVRTERIIITVEFNLFELIFLLIGQFSLFGLNLTKKVFPIQKKKINHHH